MEIRNATMDDLQAIAAVEAACFPAAEAATAEEFAGRLAHYAGHFWLLLEQGELVAFVDGFCTDMPDLTDEMYADAALHDENGAWQMIFGVNTLPRCRCRGYAGLLLQRAIADARAQGRKGLVLTCKEKLFALLCKVRLCERGRFHFHPRRGGVVSDAAAVLRERFGMRAACALRINSGISFFIRDSEKPAGFSESPFTEGSWRKTAFAIQTAL